jgi:hypothetical protein
MCSILCTIPFYKTYFPHTLTDLVHTVNNEINKMAIWFRANKLAVNINKTKYIIFRMRGKPIPIDTPDIVYNENEQNVQADPSLITILERYRDSHPDNDCRAYKLLGIYLDKYLSLDSHTNHVVKKLFRLLYCIKQPKMSFHLRDCFLCIMLSYTHT